MYGIFCPVGTESSEAGEKEFARKAGIRRDPDMYTLVVTDSALYVLMLSDPLCKTTLYGLRPPLYGSTGRTSTDTSTHVSCRPC